MSIGAINCEMTCKFDRLLGIILCMIGVVPAMVWVARFVVSVATDPRFLMIGVPFVCAGIYFIIKSKDNVEY